jgi:copper transport protein
MTGTGRPRRLGLRLGATVALVLAALFAFPAAASAHAVLVGSTPVDGSRLSTSPTTVVLHFDENVELVPGTARVISTTGLRADTGHATAGEDQSLVVIALKPNLPKGSYSVTWRVVSADTHIVSGSISFGVRQDATVLPRSTATPLTPLDIAQSSALGVGYLGIILCLGVAALTRWLWPALWGSRRTRLLVWAGWGLMTLAAFAELLLTGPRAQDSGWHGVLALSGIADTFGSPYGTALRLRIVVLVMLIPVLMSRPRRRSRVVWTSAFAVLATAELATVALGGHAAAGDDVWLAVPVAVVHLAAMALWLGGLATLFAVLLPALRRPGELPDARLKTWSLTAYGCVAALILTGEYQAWRQIQPLEALWGTPYGLTLLLKLVLVAVALAAASVAQRRILRARERTTGERQLVHAIRWSVRIEAAVLVLVVATTTVLVSEAPAATTYGPPVALTAPLGPDHVTIQVDDTRRGTQRITITPLDAAGRSVSAPTVTGTLSSGDAGISALSVDFARSSADPHTWTSLTAVPLPGLWTLTLNVGLDQATAYTTSAQYRVW